MAQMKYYYELTISSSPHVHSPVTTQTIMRDVLIALAPAMVGSVVFFGARALTVTLVSVLACVFFEWAYCRLMHKHCKVYDLSAVVTGVLLAFVCPPTIPYWILIIGDFFAIILVKMLFGGIGRNIVNPALAARAFMFSWPVAMSTWIKAGWENQASLFSSADIVTAATPLASMHQGVFDPAAGTVRDMFFGNVGGCIGETSAALLLVGFVYLLVRKVITWHTPVVFIATVFVLYLAFTGDVMMAVSQILAGGLFIGAIFMATDYVTTPITTRGRVVFALGCGVITFIIRYFCAYPEGVSFSILIMNILTPFIEKWTAKEPLGGVK